MIGGIAVFLDRGEIIKIPRVLKLRGKRLNIEEYLQGKIKNIYEFPAEIEEKLLFTGFERKGTKVSLRTTRELNELSRKIQVNIQLYGLALTSILTIVVSYLLKVVILAILILILIGCLHFYIWKKSKEDLKKMEREVERAIWGYRLSIANHLARIAFKYGKKTSLQKIKGKKYVIIEWSMLPYFSEHLIVRER